MTTSLQQSARAVRVTQLVAVFVGMAASVVAPAMMAAGPDTLPFAWLFLLGMVGLPLAYVAFAGAVERATRGVGASTRASARTFAWLTFLPGVSFVFEILLLHRLATLVQPVAEDERLPRRVLLLALARPVWSALAWPVAGALVSLLPGSEVRTVLVAQLLVALGSLALLALATQLIVQPLLDRAAMHRPVSLGATGGDSPAAVATVRGRPRA